MAVNDKGGEESKASAHKRMNIKDFEKLKFIGEGSYAKVLLVKHKETGKIYAIKAILKSHMRKV